ncbi:LysM peptidoglycan-binding domain-containing protein [Salicola sp. Rm-C-2C1-2]|uniref:lytic transglycosylase n=1 Tax=Salicola sp. Rm-C-2C1-2 TaxID=3141321 RepID=UPI0032E435F8
MHYVPLLCLLSAMSLPLLAGCESLQPREVSTESNPPAITRAVRMDANVRTDGALKPEAEEEANPETASDGYGNVWQRLRDSFQLDLESKDKRVRSQLAWYSRNQSYMDRTAERARRYLPYIIREIEKRDMPGELALLPLVESAYDPFAYSHGRASGIWQFIPATGRAFGMKQNWWYDGRRDIISATQGALSYLDELASRFDGDYELALASYNAGAGRVLRAMRRNERQGKPTDYWSLNLPAETRHYVPKLIALARIVADPQAHGIRLEPIPDDPYFEVVDIGGQLDLAQAAKMAGVDVNEIYRLNPGFNRWATPPDGPHRLLVPSDSAQQFRQALTSLPDGQRVSWRNYTVQSGDTLISIARSFNTTPDVIRQHNDISGHTIRSGERLLIPAAGNDSNAYALSESNRRAARQASAGGEGQNRIDYRINPGDTLWDIASAHGVSVSKLASWNNLAPGDTLRPGDTLAIWTDEQQPRNERREMVRRVGYTVRSGDSLRYIANRFNVGVSQIAQWNNINTQDYLQPGQQLKLYVDIRNAH